MTVLGDIWTVDAHAGGEPARVVIGGVPEPPGASVAEKARWVERHYDQLRRRLLQEPRGYPAANANLIVRATNPRAEAGFVVMEQSEYPPMSGSNVLCVAKVLLECGMIARGKELTNFFLEAPGGLVEVAAETPQGRVGRIGVRNVASLPLALDQKVSVPGLGEVMVDICYGGMIHVIAEVDQLGVKIEPARAQELARLGEAIRLATLAQAPQRHPLQTNLVGPTISYLVDPSPTSLADQVGVAVVSAGTTSSARVLAGVLDRSPCGTAICARMAALWAKGRLGVGDRLRSQGILGTVFTGEILEETELAARPAIVPAISGQAYITGYSHLVLDPQDPFRDGFRLNDIWPSEES